VFLVVGSPANHGRQQTRESESRQRFVGTAQKLLQRSALASERYFANAVNQAVQMNNLKITAGGSPESYCFTATFYREVVEDPELPSPLKQPHAAFFHGGPGQRPDRIGKVTGESISRQIACVVNPRAGIMLSQPIAELVDCLPFFVGQSHNTPPEVSVAVIWQTFR
jgi:hypothetical protein